MLLNIGDLFFKVQNIYEKNTKKLWDDGTTQTKNLRYQAKAITPYIDSLFSAFADIILS